VANLPPDPTPGEHAELAERLRALGRSPVDPAIASEHVSAMAAVKTRWSPTRARFGRAKVAAAFAAGLVLGSTGLASASAFGGKTYKNHGQFVSQGGDPHSPCGKPLQSAGKHQKHTDTPDHADHRDKAPGGGHHKGCGKPPWAGKGNHDKKTPAAVAAHRAACGEDGNDTELETPAPAPGAVAPKAPATTTTTAPRASTTTTGAATTTTAPTTTTTT
jgi:hypothetical protein